MRKRLISYALLAASAATSGSAAIVGDVREAIAENNFARGEAEIHAYRAENGVTPEMIEALSWLGRGAIAARHYSQAEAYARETAQLALEQLKTRPLDAEPHLPLALGAAIEVQAQAMAAEGARGEAIAYLRDELRKYSGTSIRTRIQKNINLLSLEGKPAPAFPVTEYLGPKPPPLRSLRGKTVLLFFWAHWCGDCKAEVSVLARLRAEYGDRLAIIGPTERYGYGAGGEDISPAAELRYIDQVRQKYYSRIPDMPIPVSAAAFKTYGASTTPTIVLIDARGIVRLYHPGRMTYDELRQALRPLLRHAAAG
jgi:thiol-disulfide isomerase/thioredoxin